jgi:23S rRNA (adenine2503-C2)-methyltransferase
MARRVALYDLTHEQLNELLEGWGEPRFRADQVWRWLYRSLVRDLNAMANLPAQLRARMAAEAETDLDLVTPLTEQTSASGQTRKVLFSLRDLNSIESVLMRYHDRRTACISTQAGCGMGCTFCATGQGGLARNLSAGEIVAQVMYLAGDIRQAEVKRARDQDLVGQIPVHPITNVVLMGMGEPLANYAATWQAIETLTSPEGYGLGARRITLSTVGLVPGIRRMAEERLPVNLAVSLHAADNELRNQLVPINTRYPLAELMGAVHNYVEKIRPRESDPTEPNARFTAGAVTRRTGRGISQDAGVARHPDDRATAARHRHRSRLWPASPAPDWHRSAVGTCVIARKQV